MMPRDVTNGRFGSEADTVTGYNDAGSTDNEVQAWRRQT